MFRPVPIDPTGRDGPTRGQAAGPGWRCSGRGVYVPSSVDGADARQRAVEQSVRLGPAGAVTGWASLRLHGAPVFDGLDRDGTSPLPVDLLSPDRQLARGDGCRVSRDRLDANERVVLDGVPCTTVERAVFDAMRRSDVREAVVVADMAAYAELTSIRRLRRYVAIRRAWRGRPVVDEALLLADERCRSADETRMRLVWRLDAGLPKPLCNPSVFTLGRPADRRTRPARHRGRSGGRVRRRRPSSSRPALPRSCPGDRPPSSRARVLHHRRRRSVRRAWGSAAHAADQGSGSVHRLVPSPGMDAPATTGLGRVPRRRTAGRPPRPARSDARAPFVSRRRSDGPFSLRFLTFRVGIPG